MTMDTEGKLVQMTGMRENSLPEERESESENDREEEGEKNWNVSHLFIQLMIFFCKYFISKVWQHIITT